MLPPHKHDDKQRHGWRARGTCRSPVFLNCFRPSGGAALYRVVGSSSLLSDEHRRQRILSVREFDVPPQPIKFALFLVPEARVTFDNPRFACHPPSPTADGTGDGGGDVSTTMSTDAVVVDVNQDRPPNNGGGWMILDVMPAVGTLVLFDSVTLPHLVMEVMGSRQRIAATGWFHEDSQFVLEV